MNGRYTWLPGSDPKGIVEPKEPSDALPVGRSLTDDERKAWRALWADRLSRGTGVWPIHASVLHSSDIPCEGTCPNGIHEEVPA